jgi:hypothetical protein
VNDSWSPAHTRPQEYWSVEECRWVPAPPVAAPVSVPLQREDEAAQEPVEA